MHETIPQITSVPNGYLPGSRHARGGVPETMKIRTLRQDQQTTALAEDDGNIFCLTTQVYNTVFRKPRRVSRPPCGQKTVLYTGVVLYK